MLRWLEQEFPCGRPVKLRWRKELTWFDRDAQKHKQYFGHTAREGARLEIVLSRRMCRRRRDALETLLHEWAHCMLWGPATLDTNPRHNDRQHKGAFGAQYWEIYDRYFHEGGREEAREARP